MAKQKRFNITISFNSLASKNRAKALKAEITKLTGLRDDFILTAALSGQLEKIKLEQKSG